MLAGRMRWLALDVGTSRVGLAVCDAGERVVTSLRPVAFPGPEGIAVALLPIIEEYGIGGLVVGVPVTRGGAGRGERRVAEVAAHLRSLGLPVQGEDERGTTAAAEALLREAGVPRRRWSLLVDGVAARLILEAFLARRNRGAPGVDPEPGEC
jgi:putative Holliday junction resolvase